MNYIIKLKKVEWQEPSTGFVIGVAVVDGSEFRIVGEFSNPVVNNHYSVEGYFAHHDHFGHAFIAGDISVSDDDVKLIDLGFSPAARNKILNASEDGKSIDKNLDPYDLGLTLSEASALASHVGTGMPSRIRAVLWALMDTPQGRWGVRESLVLESASQWVGATQGEIQQTLQAMYNDGDMVLTSTGFVVSGDQHSSAKELAETIPSENDLFICDDLQFGEMSDHCEPGLTQSEMKAVQVAMNHKSCVIDVSDDSRRDVIKNSVVGCLESLSEDSDRNIVFWDSSDISEHNAVVRAIVDAKAAPSVKAIPPMSDTIVEARETIGSAGKRLVVTCHIKEEGEFFTEGHEDDLTITAISLTVPEMVDRVVEIQNGDGQDECQIFACHEDGDLGSRNLTNELRSRLISSVPAVGPYCPGDKVMTSSGPMILDDNSKKLIKKDERADSLRPGWVLTRRDVAGCADSKWKTTILCVDEMHQKEADWRLFSAVAKRSSDRVVIVGNGKALANLRRTDVRGQPRDESLHSLLSSRRQTVTAID